MRLVKENNAVHFLGGFLLGFLLMNMGKSILLTGTGMFDEDTLYHMRYMAVDSGALFCYVLRTRFLRMSGLILLLTTYLGALTCAVMIAWYGLSAGVFLSTLLLRYGIRGFLIALAGIFPQYIFYVPAILLLLRWGDRESAGTQEGWKRKMQLLPILGLLLLGCLLEGYVNPGILLGVLKIL